MLLTVSHGIEQSLFYLASHYAGNTLDYKCVVVLRGYRTPLMILYL